MSLLHLQHSEVSHLHVLKMHISSHRIQDSFMIWLLLNSSVSSSAIFCPRIYWCLISHTRSEAREQEDPIDIVEQDFKIWTTVLGGKGQRVNLEEKKSN